MPIEEWIEYRVVDCEGYEWSDRHMLETFDIAVRYARYVAETTGGKVSILTVRCTVRDTVELQLDAEC